jgi:hypothetical protein
VRRFEFFNFANEIAPWLFIIIEIDGDLIVLKDLISSRISRSQTAAIYSVSQMDIAITDCLIDPYIIRSPAHINRYPVIDLPIYISSAQFKFKYS